METVLGVKGPFCEPKKFDINSPSFEAYFQTLSQEEKDFFYNYPPPQTWEEEVVLMDQMTEETRYQYHFGIFEAFVLLHSPNYYSLSNAGRIELANTSDKVFINHVSKWHHECRFAFNRGALRPLYNDLENDQILVLLQNIADAEQKKAK
jgi:hypothetical protein